MPDEAKAHSCYEAGRDGWWLHRWLLEQGIDNIVVDSASIEVNRRARRMRRVGIAALARRLAVALWRYLQDGEIPAGASLKPSTVRA